MRTQSPWSTIACAAILLVAALWSFQTAYAPSDATPLHWVEGSIDNIGTTWIHHSSKSSHWDAPVVTIVTSDARLIHFTAHTKDESDAVLALTDLPQGSALTAQVDADGEIWELSANDHDVVALADTLARHHELMHRRNLVCGFMVLLAVGLGVLGIKRLQSQSPV